MVDLETLAPAHAPAMFEGLADPLGYCFLPSDPPASVDALKCRYERLAAGRSAGGTEQWYNWVVRCKENRALAGYTQATVRNHIVHIGYHIFPPMWRRGFGTAALRLTLDRVFAISTIEEARALVDTRNAGSIALLKTRGFTLVQTIVDADYFKGASSSEYEFVMSRIRWLAS